MDDAAALAIRFNERINAGDLEGLAGLMSIDHTFVDTAGTALIGKAVCIEAWRRFFDAYAGYRNVFDLVSARENEVTVAGHSFCPGHPELEGPALWTAVVAHDKVSHWHVYEDTPEMRRRLGIDGGPVPVRVR